MNLRTAVARNRKNDILVVCGLPNTKKTFLSILFSIAEPIIHIDFSYKDLKSKRDIYKTYGLNVFEVPPSRLQVDDIKEMIAGLKRGTVVFDDFSCLSCQDQGELAEIALERCAKLGRPSAETPLKFTFVVRTYLGVQFKGIELRQQCITLPTSLLPLDNKNVDFAFINPGEICIHGRKEVRICI